MGYGTLGANEESCLIFCWDRQITTCLSQLLVVRFERTFHMRGKRSTYNEFLKRAKEIHNNLYSYPTEQPFEGIGGIKIKIICKKHGSFWQLPSRHLSGQGCWSCSVETRASKRHNSFITMEDTEFLKKFGRECEICHNIKARKILPNGLKESPYHYLNRKYCDKICRGIASSIIASAANIGKPKSEKHKDKLRGPKSETHKIAMSLAHANVKDGRNPRANAVISPDGRFDTITLAANHYKVGRKTIRTWIKNGKEGWAYVDQKKATTHSSENLQKYRASALRGRNSPVARAIITPKGRFPTISSAAECFKIKVSTAHARVKRNNMGWRYAV
jgi:transposase